MYAPTPEAGIDSPLAMTTDEKIARLLGSRRPSWGFATIVFATTSVQSLSNPLAVVLEGAEWTYPIPLLVVSLIVVVACALQAASLLLSGRWPGIAALLAVACYIGVIIGVEVPNWVASMPFVVAIAMFYVGVQRSARVTIGWLIIVTAAAAVGLIAWVLSTGASLGVVSGFLIQSVLTFFAPVAGAAALGIWWGVRTRRVAQAQFAAERAEREHEERIERARVHERARIAQELHDVAGQHLAGMLSLADAALDIEITAVEQALALVEDMRVEGRFASASLYSALRELRAVDRENVERTPDLADLDALVEYWARRGMQTAKNTIGDVSELPAVISTSVYRAVQESLTNVAKHAPGADVAIDLVVDHASLRVAVVNTAGHGRSADRDGLGLGWGLESLAQRVELLSGTFQAGPTSEGGWLMTVEVPILDIEPPTQANA